MNSRLKTIISAVAWIAVVAGLGYLWYAGLTDCIEKNGWFLCLRK